MSPRPFDSAGNPTKITIRGLPPEPMAIAGTSAMLTFRVRTFAALLGFSAFALLYIAVGIRWHVYRARAGEYAHREVEHPFEAANFARAARNSGYSEEDQARAAEYRRYAQMHE